MALLNDILTWTESLPAWQRDAARRLFQNKEGLSQKDLDELYHLFKVEYNLEESTDLKPEVFTNDHLPKTNTQGTQIVLNCVKNLQSVNKIAANQVLNFSDQGITVIYGDNGSGKSGYGRVLKLACRARDRSEKIYPDVEDQSAVNNTPKAILVVTQDSEKQEIEWSYGDTAPVELSQIAVFDSSCARSYITKEQDVAYLPYGLDVVENLANVVCPSISTQLQSEISSINTDTRPFDNLKGNTEVGKIFNQLSESTNVENLTQLGQLSEVEIIRHDELEKVLAEANPLDRAKELKTGVERIKHVASEIGKPVSWVSDKAIEKLKHLHDEKTKAELAELQVKKALHMDEVLLAKTGDDIWRKLFESARNFSVESIPNTSFPNSEVGSHCVLCQEPMPQKAIDRLKRFDDYITNDISIKADAARANLKKAIENISAANLQVRLNQHIIEELKQGKSNIHEQIEEFQTSVEVRREWMLNAVASGDWKGIPKLSKSPYENIRNMAASYLRQVRKLLKLVDVHKRKTMIQESDELKVRKLLSAVLEPALELIKRIKRKSELSECTKFLNTRSISTQSKRFATASVTKGLQQSLNTEFQELGIGHIQTKLKEKSIFGQMHHQLILDVPNAKKINEILSEGEQRSMAVGAFLAELSLANHSCGIIFDDPVSSLDQTKRGYVAKRLVKEASKRQVLIFTHEVIFLQLIKDYCEELNISFSSSYLDWQGNKCGFVHEGLPWVHKSVADRMDTLEKIQRQFVRRPWPDNPSYEEGLEVASQYNGLRSTCNPPIINGS